MPSHLVSLGSRRLRLTWQISHILKLPKRLHEYILINHKHRVRGVSISRGVAVSDVRGVGLVVNISGAEAAAQVDKASVVCKGEFLGGFGAVVVVNAGTRVRGRYPAAKMYQHWYTELVAVLQLLKK